MALETAPTVESGKTNRRTVQVVLAVVVVAVAAWGIYTAVQKEGGQSVAPGLAGTLGGREYTVTAPDTIAPLRPTDGVERFRAFKVAVDQSGFAPDRVVVFVGDGVQFEVTAVGGRYDLGIPTLGVYVDVPAGESRTVGFDASRPGEFPFSCKNRCPAGKVISGNLIVLER